MQNTINKKAILKESKTTRLIFLPLIIFSLVIYTIMFTNEFNLKNFLNFSFVIFIFFIPLFLNFFDKKIILTGTSIYIFSLFQKETKISLVENLKAIEVKQDFIGLIFNYGSLFILTKNNELYTYRFLINPKKIEEKILKRYNYLINNNNNK